MNNWRSDYELPGIPATLTTLVLVWPQACCAAADILTTLGLSFPIYSEGLGRSEPCTPCRGWVTVPLLSNLRPQKARAGEVLVLIMQKGR